MGAWRARVEGDEDARQPGLEAAVDVGDGVVAGAGEELRGGGGVGARCVQEDDAAAGTCGRREGALGHQFVRTQHSVRSEEAQGVGLGSWRLGALGAPATPF